ncbi:MAG TPA: hypothetical protein VL285_25145 [Bryobacteraceae bacterium]|jgi:hypothetical protein|nr:hypothetical protein [Bryobacteraceae bacterium]
MAVVRLVCWNEDLARERARALTDREIEVDASPLTPGSLRQFRENPPAAVVIDLDRLPSHGREVAVSLRNSKATRYLPLVFAGGLDEKVARIRQELPDASYTDWKNAIRALRKAMKAPPTEPVLPTPHMQRYAGSSLVKKLSIPAAAETALLGAPDGFEETLGELPEGARLQPKLTARSKLILWFVRSRREMETAAELLGLRLAEGASAWIIHPKQSGRYKVDFNQNDVRGAALAAGLVDYKVCAVDADWSGLKFARKKS